MPSRLWPPLPVDAFARSILHRQRRWRVFCLYCITATLARCIARFPATTTRRIAKFDQPSKMALFSHWGQYIALVVAETLEQATAAAAAVRAEYDAETRKSARRVSTTIPASARRAASAETSRAHSKLRRSRSIRPTLHPSKRTTPSRLHASVAVWEGDRLTMYETSQGVVNHRVVMAQTLGIPVENVRVVTRFLGSGFGGKLFPWPHCAMNAVAARKLGRPVKLSVTRRMMFSSVGYRPRTEQRLRIGASKDGKLLALKQDYLNVTSLLDDFDEDCGEATPYLYSVANLEVTSGMVRRNVGAPVHARPRRGSRSIWSSKPR